MYGLSAVQPGHPSSFLLPKPSLPGLPSYSAPGSNRQSFARYIDFVRAGVGLPSLWAQLHHQIYLGSEQFVQRVQREVESLEMLQEVRAQRRPVARPLLQGQALASSTMRARTGFSTT
jgi:hypothetical protein